MIRRYLLRSARFRAVAALGVSLVMGMHLLFPTLHSCRSGETSWHAGAGVAQTGAHPIGDAAATEGGARHHEHRSSTMSDCSCVGVACCSALAAPMPTTALAIAPAVAMAVPRLATPNEYPVIRHTHVLPFANGPPQLQA